MAGCGAGLCAPWPRRSPHSSPVTLGHVELRPDLLFAPRRSTAIFFNAASGLDGAEGSETDEYNYFYGPNGIFRVGGPGGTAFFDEVRTYEHVIEKESDYLLTYMLRGEIYPQMYHQSNFWRYDGARCLFTDVHDRAFAKLAKVSSLPAMSLSQRFLISSRSRVRLASRRSA